MIFSFFYDFDNVLKIFLRYSYDFDNVLKCVYHVNSKIVPSWKKLTNLSDTLDHNNRSR